MKPPHLLWRLAAFPLAALHAATAAASVNVGMEAAFSAGPYLLELLETAAAENSSAYFPLLDRIASGHFSSSSSDADLYSSFLNVIRNEGHIKSPEALSTFNLSLALRSAAPRIEAHYQYYSTAVEPALANSTCQTWVLLQGKQYCTPSLDTAAQEGILSDRVFDLPFDRVLGSGPEAVLYADPTSESFAVFHDTLSKAVKTHKLSYRVRYRRRGDPVDSQPIPVSGYGVELALKKTDYVVIDDRDSNEGSQQEALSSEKIFSGEEDIADLRPLSTSELSSLGLKAASFIQRSDDPFQTLVKLAQDFPKFSGFIASCNASNEFIGNFESNEVQMVPGGVNVLWMNGIQLIERQIDPFSLADMLRRERNLIEGVRNLGFSGNQIVSLLSHNTVTASKQNDGPTRFDWTDRSEDGKVIVWLNDLENDPRYADYPKSLASLLQPIYPGQMPPISRNIFNLIIPADFSNPEDLSFVAQISPIISRRIPIRIGLVPLMPTAEAINQAKVVYHLAGSYGSGAVITYIRELSSNSQGANSDKIFADAFSGQELLPQRHEMSLKEVLDSSNYADQSRLAQIWAERLNANTPIRPLLINGIVTPRDKNWMQTISMKIGDDLEIVQRGIYHGTLDEDTWVPGIFLKGAAIKRNLYISGDNKPPQILDVSKIYSVNADLFNHVPVLNSDSESTRDDWAVLTVVSDMTTVDGATLLLDSLEFKRNHPGIRLDYVHNPKDLSTFSPLNAALQNEKVDLTNIRTLQELHSIAETAPDFITTDDHTTALSAFLNSAKIMAGSSVLILNGRIVGPIASNSSFKVDDFKQLLVFEKTRRLMPVYAAIDELGLSEKLSSAIAAATVTSITALSTISELPEGIFDTAPTIRSSPYESWNLSHATIEMGDFQTASIHFIGLLDPVSEKAQRWASILKILSELDGVYLRIILNPKQHITELPVKRFYRYVMESKPSFDEDGKTKQLSAKFANLPSDALLTVGMDVPPAWLVAPKASHFDLDNIKLSSAKSEIDATYELEHILIEGHSREGQNSPPRGAQLVLATEKDPLVTDTIIMANLGYFQFKANPGYYNIKLKDGRSSDIFTIDSIGIHGWDESPNEKGTNLALMDFQGATLYPHLKRKPEMEGEDVLERAEISHVESSVSNGAKFVANLFGRLKGQPSAEPEHAEINIFSVASGHLYERMLNIMMVSVMRNTKHSVKFWFIEQFLSPSFKAFIPHMAEQYGFKYQMVTYKWPHWLRSQKEKQREIWGYKILFLDVLFPLSLDKVIFVDADQIVRTDMIELVKMDLQGAPYGFTPMCDSRIDMEGFRFWKQGYWANYLRGRPYHISALYVVDLRRFRELAAGDRLRQQYHALSADPASLSNLDQDLPNHMQFQIPIHSLPQEWLWCETWCSDESLATARTIDLCNNPQTKEPKLDRARRQVPEWTIYDDEIAALRERFQQKEDGKESTDTVLADHGPEGTSAQVESGGQESVNEELFRKGEKANKAHSIDEL